MEATGRVIDWATLASELPFAGVTRQCAQTQFVTIWRYEFEPHCSYPSQKQSTDKIILVAEGEVSLHVDETSYLLGPGRLARIPSGAVHQAETGPQSCIFYEFVVAVATCGQTAT